MNYYPVFLRVAGRRCVVIGGGEVADRKVMSRVGAGASVVVVSPSLSADLAALAARGEIEHAARPYRAGDLDGALLAYAASDDDALHAVLAEEAERAGVLLNVVDRPRWCDFIVPSLFR